METSARETRRAPAYYWAAVRHFLAESPHEILGRLASANQFPLEGDQRDAWQQEIEILQNALAGLDGTIYLEFDVPRLGRRIDAALILGAAIFPIEFKCGATEYRRADYNQAWDYGCFSRPMSSPNCLPTSGPQSVRARGSLR